MAKQADPPRSVQPMSGVAPDAALIAAKVALLVEPVSAMFGSGRVAWDWLR